jgi:hypothetical protein
MLVRRNRDVLAALASLCAVLLLVWPISYWWPLGDYLRLISGKDYAKVAPALFLIVFGYLFFVVANLVAAALSLFRSRVRVRVWLLLISSVAVVILPFVGAGLSGSIDKTKSFSDVLGGIFGLVRFKTQGQLAGTLVLTYLAVLFSVFAIVVLLRGYELRARQAKLDGEIIVEAVSPKLVLWYRIVAAALSVTIIAVASVTILQANVRNTDRVACIAFAKVKAPSLEVEFDQYAKGVAPISKLAGSSDLRTSLAAMAVAFKSYYTNYLQGTDTTTAGNLAVFERNNVIDYCSTIVD